MTLYVRDATADDMGAVQSIYARHVLEGVASFEEAPPTLAEMQARREAILRLGLPYLVAEQEGIVRGYSYAGPHRPRSAYRFTVENSVYVAEGYGMRGIGHALLSTLIERCELGPWRQMIAVIGDSANAASVALHAKLGFAPVGIVKAVGFKHGRWLDSVLMQRPLGDGECSAPGADPKASPGPAGL